MNAIVYVVFVMFWAVPLAAVALYWHHQAKKEQGYHAKGFARDMSVVFYCASLAVLVLGVIGAVAF